MITIMIIEIVRMMPINLFFNNALHVLGRESDSLVIDAYK